MVVLAGAKVFLQCVAGSVCQSHDSELLLVSQPPYWSEGHGSVRDGEGSLPHV